MLVTITAARLGSALASLLGVAPERNALLPILTHVLITAEDGSLRVEATDHALHVRLEVAAIVTRPGGIAVPLRVVSDLASGLGDLECTLEVDPATWILMVTTTAGHRFRIHGQDASAFPPMAASEAPSVSSAGIDATLLSTVLGQVVFACARESAKPALTGVYLSVTSDRLQAVGTDGYRLAHREVMLSSDTSVGSAAFILRAEDARRLSALLHGRDVVRMALTDRGNHLLLACPGLVASALPIAAEFIAYDDLLRGADSVSTVVSRSGLLHQLELCWSVGRSERQVATLSIKPAVVVVEAEVPELGYSRVPVEAETQGESASIDVDLGHLRAGCQAAHSVRIELAVSDGRRVMVRSSDRGFQYVMSSVLTGRDETVS